jgi:hypothetical protein
MTTERKIESNEDLPTALLRERDRVRDVVLPAYEEIGDAGFLAITLTLKPALALAEKALKEHDAIAMVQALTALRDIDL